MSSATHRIVLLLVALVITALAFANTMSGGFVYDDRLLIVENDRIRQPGELGRLLTGDLFGHHGRGEQAATRYWRPAFGLWLAANQRLFGMDPRGWHLAVLLLHAAVIVLASEVLRSLAVSPAVSAAALWIFAAHPIHTTSVAWLSGATDVLVALFVLGSYAAYLASRDRAGGGVARPVSLALFAAALLSKETAVLFPLLIAVSDWSLADDGSEPTRTRVRQSAQAAGPYLVVALFWLVARRIVLGPAIASAADPPPLIELLLALPATIWFYVRQLIWPISLGPVYDVGPLSWDRLGPGSFFGPLLAVGVLAGIGVWLWRRGRPYPIGITLLLFPLVPCLNLAFFPAERMVQDRYLYLPLLGFALVAFESLRESVASKRGERPARIAVVTVAVLLCAVLVPRTMAYNLAWRSEIALWEHAVATSPHSPFALANLGFHYREAGRHPEARDALDRALAVDPTTTQALMDLALLEIGAGRHAVAQQRLEQLLAIDADHEVALEHLGALYARQERFAEALALFRDARNRLGDLHLRHTLNIGALHTKLGQPEQALSELESIRAELASVEDPALLVGYFHLGEACLQLERHEQAGTAYREYVSRTEGVREPAVRRWRDVALRRLADLRELESAK